MLPSYHCGPQVPAVKPIVPLSSCIKAWAAPEELSDWLSPATNTKTTAEKTARFKTFPPYLMIHARRFYMGYARLVMHSRLAHWLGIG